MAADPYSENLFNDLEWPKNQSPLPDRVYVASPCPQSEHREGHRVDQLLAGMADVDLFDPLLFSLIFSECKSEASGAFQGSQTVDNVGNDLPTLAAAEMGEISKEGVMQAPTIQGSWQCAMTSAPSAYDPLVPTLFLGSANPGSRKRHRSSGEVMRHPSPSYILISHTGKQFGAAWQKMCDQGRACL